MARAPRPETQMKLLMTAYIHQFGLTHNTDIVVENGDRVYIICSNPFGYGYIRIIRSNEVWSANLNKNQQVCTPKRKALELEDLQAPIREKLRRALELDNLYMSGNLTEKETLANHAEHHQIQLWLEDHGHPLSSLLEKLEKEGQSDSQTAFSAQKETTQSKSITTEEARLQLDERERRLLSSALQAIRASDRERRYLCYWIDFFRCKCGFSAESISLMLLHARTCEENWLHDVTEIEFPIWSRWEGRPAGLVEKPPYQKRGR